MSSLTRLAASSFSLVTLPMILVLTGPAGGNVSLIVSAWKRIAASANTVEYTPHASSQGSVRSSYLKPSTSRPLTNVSDHSLRDAVSVSTNSVRSPASVASVPSSMYSAKLSLNSSSPSSASSGTSVISTLPSARVTISGLTMSISISSASAAPNASMPCGAA